jgi:hypothetical protein
MAKSLSIAGEYGRSRNANLPEGSREGLSGMYRMQMSQSEIEGRNLILSLHYRLLPNQPAMTLPEPCLRPLGAACGIFRSQPQYAARSEGSGLARGVRQ